MSLCAYLFDGLLASTLVWIAWRSLATPDLFKAVVLFIAFGLLMTLAWVRLAAPDIALAEAAIGAGLTGALLLDAVGHVSGGRPPRGTAATGAEVRLPPGRRLERLAAAVLALSLGMALLAAMMVLPDPAIELSARVGAHLAESGVRHPVTAVLLNFRGYDTLLEVGVLLLAVLGVLAQRGAGPAPVARPWPSANPLLTALLRLVIPLMVLTAGYLLWAGGHQTGGAFQAGALLGGAGVLLCLSGLIPQLRSPVWCAVLVLGFGVFLAIAAAAVAGGAQLLEYPRGWAGALILLIESSLTLSIAAILITLFAVASHGPGRRSSPARNSGDGSGRP